MATGNSQDVKKPAPQRYLHLHIFLQRAMLNYACESGKAGGESPRKLTRKFVIFCA